jgi:hypothetical protein
MIKRALVQLAGRALALNLLLWSIYCFVYIPVYSFSLSHYARLTPTSASQEYLFRYYFILLRSHVFMTSAIFLAAIWIYKCGPTVESFLSPRQE